MCYDGETWDASSTVVRKARKSYECDECRRTIAAGETYERVGALFEGQWDTYRTCEQCVAARRWIKVVCGSWMQPGLLEELEEHWDESPLYRSHWLGRAILGVRRKWEGMAPLPDPRPTLILRGVELSRADLS